MSKILVPMEMPEDCLSCPFLMDEQYIYRPGGLYMRIACCRFAPERMGDPYRNIHELYDFKEKWCPLEEVKEG